MSTTSVPAMSSPVSMVLPSISVILYEPPPGLFTVSTVVAGLGNNCRNILQVPPPAHYLPENYISSRMQKAPAPQPGLGNTNLQKTSSRKYQSRYRRHPYSHWWQG